MLALIHIILNIRTKRKKFNNTTDVYFYETQFYFFITAANIDSHILFCGVFYEFVLVPSNQNVKL